MSARFMGIAKRFNCCLEATGSTTRSMSQLSPAEFLATLEAGNTPDASIRALMIAAHPDDETISASAVLGRLGERTVIYLTDGAPRDPQFRTPHVSGSREMYALVRAEEAASALALAGVPASRISFLNAVDQEAIGEVQRLVHEIVEVIQTREPQVILTHPYEGGHPDHDTAALVARLAVNELQRRRVALPTICEFTSYHASGGNRVSGEFLPSNGDQNAIGEVLLQLSPEERARTARM